MIEYCQECGLQEIDNQDTGLCWDCHGNEHYALCPVCESINDLSECEHVHFAMVVSGELGVYKGVEFIKTIPLPRSMNIDLEENLYPVEYHICNQCSDKI